RIDRLIVRGHDILIVDYKTNRPPPRTLADIDPAYVWQLALYRLALETLYPEKSVRAAILWTEDLKLMEVSSSAMDQALHGRVERMAAGLDPRIPGTYVSG
ncbi:MAG: PD-(D/E)XK nuclease family protein, partial [Pseudomonadota bacterium]